MSTPLPPHSDEWILEKAPCSDVVISSRARLARNLPGLPFAPHADQAQMAAITQAVAEALAKSDYFKKFHLYDLAELPKRDRGFLKESHLISPEMEKGGAYRQVYLNGDARTSIMINEEDHLRIQTMLAGFQVAEAYQRIERIEQELERVAGFAYNPQFGYLSACPTNTGTGLRMSVMVHLVGLVMTDKVNGALESLGNLGLVVRGAYGEHSTHQGDLFQISNEVTLGKTEESLIEGLEQVVGQIIEREHEARELLYKHEGERCEDAVSRAVGTLRHARAMDTSEAVTLLSRIRLGIGRDASLKITHEELNRLLIDVQPAHLRIRAKVAEGATEDGDRARAAFLRERFDRVTGGGNGSEDAEAN